MYIYTIVVIFENAGKPNSKLCFSMLLPLRVFDQARIHIMYILLIDFVYKSMTLKYINQHYRIYTRLD